MWSGEQSWLQSWAPDCLEEESRADAMSFLGLLPSHRSDKNSISEDCGPGEEEEDPAVCVSWGERASTSTPPAATGRRQAQTRSLKS